MAGRDRNVRGDTVNELQRRRQLTDLTKTELIDRIIALEAGINNLRERIDAAYGDEP